MPSDTQLEELAAALIDARREAMPIPQAGHGGLTLDDAYKVQRKLARRSLDAGEQIAGWKVGLTSAPAMAAFGATEPIAGPIFAGSVLRSGDSVDLERFCDARVEGEILIEIGKIPEPLCSDDVLVGSIASIRPAIEVADSRIIGWPSGAALAVADDACCGCVVLGSPFDHRGLDLATIRMELTADGRVVSEGVGANCLGNPLAVYRWFLGHARSVDWRISPGDLLLTGALGPPVAAGTTKHFQARLSGLGRVDLHVSSSA